MLVELLIHSFSGKMSYIKSLKNVLQEKNIKLFNRIDEIEKQARNILQYAQGKFPYYTPHGFLHSENVLENLNWLMPDELKKEPNDYELFFLIISAWLHDWGMVGEPHEKPEDIRKNHHIRTEKKFESKYSLVGVHQNEARLIGRICRGHREEDLYDEKYDDIPFEKGVLVHRRFLTAVLRIADKVDVTASRVPEIIYYDLNPCEKAQEEFEKQMNVIGVGYPSEKEKHKLILSAVAWDPIGVRVLEKLVNKIQKELNQVKTILATGIRGKSIPLDYVELKVDTRGFMREPIEFELDRQKILDLLIGQNLYSRRDVGIRELIQNSIDACRLRKSIEGDYTAKIVIHENDGTVIVEDNGVGMDFDAAKDYLSLVGASFYLTDEFKKLVSGDTQFDPISRWGLGILSCFLMSSKVIIETKKAGARSCRFIITGVDKGWRYEVGSMERVGTRVTLHLKEDEHEISIEETLKYYMKKLEIPIFLRKGDKRREFVPEWDLEMAEITGGTDAEEFIKKHGKPKITFKYNVETELYEATFYGVKQFPGGWYLPQNSWFICAQGIHVDIPMKNWASFTPRTVAVFVNLKRNVVDLEVSREKIVANEKFKKLIQSIFSAYLEEVRKDFLRDAQRQRLEPIEKELDFLLFVGSRVVADRFPSSELQRFVLDSTVPLLTTKGLTWDTLNSISDHKPEHISAFLVGLPSTRKECIEFVRTVRILLKNRLAENELVTICFIPGFLRGGDERFRKIVDQFFSASGIKHDFPSFESCVHACKQTHKVCTAIDEILPPDCHFAKFPRGLRSSFITIRAFSPASERTQMQSHLSLEVYLEHCLLLWICPTYLTALRNPLSSAWVQIS